MITPLVFLLPHFTGLQKQYHDLSILLVWGLYSKFVIKLDSIIAYYSVVKFTAVCKKDETRH
jgi:hypothetical protein